MYGDFDRSPAPPPSRRRISGDGPYERYPSKKHQDEWKKRKKRQQIEDEWLLLGIDPVDRELEAILSC